MSIAITEARSGLELARAEIGADVVKYEGNLYFTPATVSTPLLRVTERTYTCPSKGTCNWVDFVAPDGSTVQNVAWIYQAVKPGHEAIVGRYGFYPGERGGTRQIMS